MQNVVPRLTRNPGHIRWAAKGLGVDTDTILDELGYTATDIAMLRANGVV